MKFSTNRDVLLTVLKGIKPAVPAKSNIPVLLTVYLKATKDNELIVRGSDLDLSIEKTITVEVQDPGEICVPFKQFFDLMSNLPAILIDLSLDGGKMVIMAEKKKYSMGTEPADNYPEFFNETDDSSETFDVAVKMIQKVINKTEFATSSDELRPIMQGVYLTTEDNNPVWVATDGHRLAKLVVDSSLILNDGVVFPQEFLNSIVNIDSEMITIKLFPNHVVAIGGDQTKIISRKIEGKFPKYNAVIPGDLTDSIRFNRAEMLQALRRVLIFANNVSKQVLFTLNKDHIVIESNDEGSSGKEIIPCESALESFLMGFNGAYLVDILSTCQNDRILLKVIDPKKACIFYDGEEVEKSIFLQMPVRLGED